MKKKTVYEGKNLSISIYDVIIQRKKIQREIIEQRGATAILAFDGKDVILVKQNRFPHGCVLEIPAGTLEKGEDPLDCAFREFQEETGYKAKKMKRLITIYPNVGYNTQFIHCYIASGLTKTNDLKLNEDEFIMVIKMDFQKLLTLIKTGKIKDAKTICAALTYAAKNQFKIID